MSYEKNWLPPGPSAGQEFRVILRHLCDDEDVQPCRDVSLEMNSAPAALTDDIRISVE